MKRLIIGTNNQGKVKEIKAILGNFYDEILSLREAGIQLDVEEDGDTFEENAIKKATEAARVTGCDTLADDSGLCVDALLGAPGIYSARYAGEDVSYEENNKKLLKELEGIKDRSAKFVCAMALVQGNEVITAFGEVHGIITEKLCGSGGFGYDPLFYVPEYGKTFGELNADVKNKISHRSRALEALKDKLAERSDV